jgi:hypothetical protein
MNYAHDSSLFSQVQIAHIYKHLTLSLCLSFSTDRAVNVIVGPRVKIFCRRKNRPAWLWHSGPDYLPCKFHPEPLTTLISFRCICIIVAFKSTCNTDAILVGDIFLPRPSVHQAPSSFPRLMYFWKVIIIIFPFTSQSQILPSCNKSHGQVHVEPGDKVKLY